MDIASARRRYHRRSTLLGTGVFALVALAGCGTTATTAASHGGAATTVATAVSASATTTPTTAPTTATTTSTTTGSATSSVAPSRFSNLTASTQVKLALAQALVAGTPGLQPSDVDGTVPGTVFYAQDNQTGMQYAVAAIAPSATLQPGAAASPQGFSQFNPFPFTKAPGGAWKVGPGGLDYMGAHCPDGIPNDVLIFWGQTPGACHFPNGS